MSRELVVIDLGGTHARFAVAAIDERTGRPTIGEVTTLATGRFASLADAWCAFERQSNRHLPRAVAIAAAGPVRGGRVELTNQPWEIDRDAIARSVGFDMVILLNDLEAIAYAIAHARDDELTHICGPEGPLPKNGLTSVVGIGTGLGTAMLVRNGGDVETHAAEGGHMGFAPVDAAEDRLLDDLRKSFGRVSVERAAAGPAIVAVHRLIGGKGQRDDRQLWQAALANDDGDAREAANRICRSIGSFASDLALAQGANAVVLTGGLGRRLEPLLGPSGFAERFRDKGRFADDMASVPVKLLTMEQPGLIGAAVAFVSSDRPPSGPATAS